jgi:hypothetical protein
MGMADPRSFEQKNEDFCRSKQRIIGLVEDLIAVNHLECHNKDWLVGNNRNRCEAIAETLYRIRGELHKLNRKAVPIVEECPQHKDQLPDFICEECGYSGKGHELLYEDGNTTLYCPVCCTTSWVWA